MKVEEIVIRPMRKEEYPLLDDFGKQTDDYIMVLDQM